MNHKYIIETIEKSGNEIFIVGGTVRDKLLGLTPDDMDLVTNLSPLELQSLFKNDKVVNAGATFLVTMINGIDVATYRTDHNEKNGRHNCKVTQAKTLTEDLQRRDFTFNALALSPNGDLVDLFNGKEDLKNKIVRFVGNPEQRIKEDYLRMIRACRFACLIEGRFHVDAFKAIRKNAHLIKEVAPERIRMELLKAMKYKTPSIFFTMLHTTGLLDHIIPEMHPMFGHDGGEFHGETINFHSMLTGDSMSKKNPLLRLIGYFHDIGKPSTWDGKNFIDHEKVGSKMIDEIFKRFRFSNKEVEFAKGLILHHTRALIGDISDKGVRRLLKKFGDDEVNWKNWFQLKMADKKSNLLKGGYSRQQIKECCLKVRNATKITKSGEFKITDLAINGNDVMNTLNIKPGKQVGETLKKLLELVIDSPELNQTNELLNLLKEV